MASDTIPSLNRDFEKAVFLNDEEKSADFLERLQEHYEVLPLETRYKNLVAAYSVLFGGQSSIIDSDVEKLCKSSHIEKKHEFLLAAMAESAPQLLFRPDCTEVLERYVELASFYEGDMQDAIFAVTAEHIKGLSNFSGSFGPQTPQ